MSTPTGLLRLGLTLPEPTEPVADRALHMALLAGRLGYWAVWLTVHPGRWPNDGWLRALTERAAPSAVGIVLHRPAATHLTELRSLPRDVLVELDPPTDREAMVDALGGPAAWQTRAYVRDGGATIDHEAAGLVISGPTRPEIHQRLSAAASARDALGPPAGHLSLTVPLTVSMGRTAREADARARRDPVLAGARHPGIAGLFGTLEHAQAQALALRRAGADSMRATLADEHDVADLLAQLRAVVVGPTPVLHERSV